MLALTAWTLQVAAPSVVLTMFQIAQIALVSVSLPFKRDVAVSIAAHQQAHQPLHQIEEVEKDKQHLALLGRVDALVVHQFIAQIDPVMHKEHPQQIDGVVSLERQYGCADNLHRRKDTIFFQNPTPPCPPTASANRCHEMQPSGFSDEFPQKMPQNDDLASFLIVQYSKMQYLCRQSYSFNPF